MFLEFGVMMNFEHLFFCRFAKRCMSKLMVFGWCPAVLVKAHPTPAGQPKKKSHGIVPVVVQSHRQVSPVFKKSERFMAEGHH